MKLPENKQDRLKLFIVIGLATVLVLLGIVQGIVNPLLRARRAQLDRLTQCQEGLRLARRETARETADRVRNRRALETAMDISTHHVLQPVLGNYVLGASQIIEAHVVTNGLTMEPVREVGITDLPQVRAAAKGKDPGKVLSLYTARVALVCGYNDLVRLLRGIESENPFLCIANLTVAADPASPEAHRVAFDVQWPIWADNRMPDTLREQLAESGRALPSANPAGAAP